MIKNDWRQRILHALPKRRLMAALTGIRPSRGASHFGRMYDDDPDPWKFRTSTYEQAKYRRSLETLATRRFRSAFEVGCSIGVFTQLLAPRCDALLGIDIVEQPLQTARTTCAEQPWVRFRRMQVPDEWPDEVFDLIVMSEVLYFLSKKDVARVAERTLSSLDAEGLVLLVNWRGRSDDPCTGDEAAELFIERTSALLEPRLQHQEETYRLDLLGRLA
jgi:2-polyprenyl-3-methyl-5-hydroxy-6-metoxy-1,4-benzoquinol methylase